MAVIRKCKYCKNRISIREMLGGQWVAFDIGTNDVHRCKKNQKVKREISLNFDVIFADPFPTLNFYGKAGKVDALRRILVKIIQENLFAEILYSGSEDTILRKIKPLKVYNRDEKWYCESYCYLRAEKRTFNLKNIHEITVISKESVTGGYINLLRTEDMQKSKLDYIYAKTKHLPEKEESDVNYPTSQISETENSLQEDDRFPVLISVIICVVILIYLIKSL